VAGEWEGAQTRMFVARPAWQGLGAGHGRLRGRRAQVVATGPGRGGAAAGAVAVAARLGRLGEPGGPGERGGSGLA
jgi:hypothetical protein